MRRGFLLTLSVLSVAACTDQPAGPEASQADLYGSPRATHTVRLFYLVPADREPVQHYARNVGSAQEHVQIWLRNELPNRQTYTHTRPIVHTVRLPHPANWYATNPNGDDERFWFWSNALSDAFALTGGGFYDPDDVWVYYIDADPACGQIIGAAAGVALLSANDLRGLSSELTRSPCTGDPEPDPGVCRWIGGLGHEIGHAFGLPHPPGCDEGEPFCAFGSLMWLGYFTYPLAMLTPAEQTMLMQSPFFSAKNLPPHLPACSRGRPLFSAGMTLGAEGAWSSAAPGCDHAVLSERLASRMSP